MKRATVAQFAATLSGLYGLSPTHLEAAIGETNFDLGMEGLAPPDFGYLSSFRQVAAMNVAFGNPAGDPYAVDVARLQSQMLNVVDELGEFYVATGCDAALVAAGVEAFKAHITEAMAGDEEFGMDFIKARDAVCDIQVFAMGGQHFMGVDGDDDMRAVVEGVMTRFIKDDADKAATIAKHAAKGVTEVYFEGEYPRMVMKSAKDQPDAPKGKFLKSASFREPDFPMIARPRPKPLEGAEWPFPTKDAAPCSSEPAEDPSATGYVCQDPSDGGNTD